jgi:hypothetical protein
MSAGEKGRKRLQPKMTRGAFRWQFVIWSLWTVLQLVSVIMQLASATVWDSRDYSVAKVVRRSVGGRSTRRCRRILGSPAQSSNRNGAVRDTHDTIYLGFDSLFGLNRGNPRLHPYQAPTRQARRRQPQISPWQRNHSHNCRTDLSRDPRLDRHGRVSRVLTSGHVVSRRSAHRPCCPQRPEGHYRPPVGRIP